MGVNSITGAGLKEAMAGAQVVIDLTNSPSFEDGAMRPGGGYSPCHFHPRSAFIYATVLEGAIRSQVNDRPVTTYKAGQSFSELPGERHGPQH
jgi:Cupin domain